MDRQSRGTVTVPLRSDARRAKPEERGVLTRYAATTKVKRNAADATFYESHQN